jgi:hypothetical protein
MLVALAVLLLVAISLARHGPTVQSPPTASPGASIHVTASHLRLGDYALTLYGREQSSSSRFCEAQIASRTHLLSAVDFTARIPSRLPCYVTGTATSKGSIPITPGPYALIISVPQGTGFDPHHSYISRPLRIT